MSTYTGKTVEELRAYLTGGKVDFSGWERRVLKELQDQVNAGKCEIEKDENGTAQRVASIAKVFIYDEARDLLLMNPINSFESPKFVEQTRSSSAQALDHFQQVVADAEKRKAPDMSNEFNTAGQSRSKSENVEIPVAFLFETTFSPFKETPRAAAARVMAWRFSLEYVSAKVFHMKSPMKVKVYNSSHFPGLHSEYHVHHVKVNPEFIAPLQKAVPLSAVTPMTLEKATNTNINTHWYCWIPANASSDEMVEELSRSYENNEKVQALVGEADFSGEAAKAVGHFMKEEATLLALWE